MVWKRVWTMPVGMNKCVFRTERRTFERSIITKWTYLFLTREGKIKKGLQGWNYRQGELQQRLRGTSTRPARKRRARPAWEHRKARSENDDCAARRPKLYPRWACGQLKTGGTYPAIRLSFFYPASSGFSKMDVASGLEKPLLAGCPSSLLFWKKKRKHLIAGYEAGNETYQKTVSTESHSEQEREGSEKNLLGIHSFGNLLPRPQESFVVKIISKRG